MSNPEEARVKDLSTQVEIDASIATVWKILTDLGGFAEWNPFMPEAEGDVREGARLKVLMEPPGGKTMTFRPTVTRVDPETELRWLGHLLFPGLFDGEHIFELSSLGDGRVRLIQRETFRGLLVPLLWKSMATSTRNGFEAMNVALKKRAEQIGRLPRQ